MPRPVPEINSAPQADIAFMLLIFFLVTTTMSVDRGISRILPPMPKDSPEEIQKDVKERNVFVVLINKYDQLLVEGQPMDIRLLREKAKEFFLNPQNKDVLPEKEITNIEYLGNIEVTPRAVISLQNDRGTSYDMYIKVQNELAAAVHELQDEVSISYFGKKFDDLPEVHQKAVKKARPMAVSEAEPKDTGGKK